VVTGQICCHLLCSLKLLKCVAMNEVSELCCNPFSKAKLCFIKTQRNRSLCFLACVVD
jgi:hypothetical protein